MSPHPQGSLAGSRVALRPVAADDIAAIEDWWPEAAATVRGVREPVAVGELQHLVDEAGCETLVIAKADEPAPIGLLVYRLSGGGWLEFRFVAMAQGLRGWGYGSEAVKLVEASGIARRYGARVSDRNGLGLYFWLRMGYRAADAGQLPQLDNEPEDGITMVRDQKE